MGRFPALTPLPPGDSSVKLSLTVIFPTPTFPPTPGGWWIYCSSLKENAVQSSAACVPESLCCTLHSAYGVNTRSLVSSRLLPGSCLNWCCLCFRATGCCPVRHGAGSMAITVRPVTVCTSIRIHTREQTITTSTTMAPLMSSTPLVSRSAGPSPPQRFNGGNERFQNGPKRDRSEVQD